jgi:ABC-type transport system involved in Fe-S cluster assembly fused permease/ATPase subunit
VSAPTVANLSRPVNADAEMLSEINQSKKKIESLFKEYLVAFDASHDDSQRKIRVGLPLTSMADNLIHFAYDVADKGVIMQWKFSPTKAHGTQWNFHAFVSQSRTASIAVSANF